LRMAYDVFLSYAHLDNRALRGKVGFVTRLAEAIRVKGSIKLGRDVSVCTDGEIPPGAEWEGNLLQKLWFSRVLVPVISPSWLNSKWSNKEWNEKWKDVKGDLFYTSQTCILPVAFQLDEAARKNIEAQQRTLQFSKGIFLDPMDDAEFDDALTPLLDSLKTTLTALDRLEKPLQMSRGKVFLGMAFSRQVHRWRRAVRQSLRGAHFDVYQFDWWDNWTPEDITRKCTDAMEECIGAVHFLDSIPGPAGSELGTGDGPFPIQFQLDAGRKKMESGDRFFQISWAGPQKELKESNSADRITRLVPTRRYWDFLRPLLDESNTDSVPRFSNDVLLKELEDLVKGPRQTKVDDDETYMRERGKPVACIVCDPDDRPVAERVKVYLEKDRGWKVRFPKPGEVTDEFPRKSSAFFFYWGPLEWGVRNFKDLWKHRMVLNEVGPPWAIAIYLGEEYRPDKNGTEAKIALSPDGSWACLTDGNYMDFDPDRVPPGLETFLVEAETKAKEFQRKAEALKAKGALDCI